MSLHRLPSLGSPPEEFPFMGVPAGLTDCRVWLFLCVCTVERFLFPWAGAVSRHWDRSCMEALSIPSPMPIEPMP